MEYKYYVNAVEFYRDVMKVVPELNLNKSLRLLDESFYLGEVYQPTTYLENALNRMNELAGKEVFAPRLSSVHNSGYTIFYPQGVSALEVVVTAKVKKVKEDVVEKVEEVAVVEELVEAQTENTLTNNTPDWAWVDTLKSVKADKVKLDKYAEGFGIKLNRSNTLTNMIKDFKKQL